MNRKGITAIMATLLLISFAVALGVVIMNFAGAQVEQEAQCTIDVGLKFSKIGGEEQFCFDGSKNQLFFTIENGVNIKVEGLVINIIGTQNVLSYDLSDAKIGKAGTYLKTVPYDPTQLGKLRQIKIVPKVNMYDEELICQDKAIVLEKVRDCAV